MGANPRNKGKSGEYEVIKMLQIICDEIWREFWMVAPTLRRNTAQYADGGEDIAGLPWYAVEVKRCETLQLAKWWLQCSTEALKSHPTALVETFTEDCPENWARTCKPFDFLGTKNSGFKQQGSISGNGTNYIQSVNNSGQVVDKLSTSIHTYPQNVDKLETPSLFPELDRGARVRPSPKIDFSPALNEKKEAFGFGTKIPILLFRQSKQRWRVMLPVQIPVGVDGRSMSSVGEISIEAFQLWLRSDIRARLLQVYGTPPIR